MSNYGEDVKTVQQIQLQSGTTSTLVEPVYPGCSCDRIWLYFATFFIDGHLIAIHLSIIK